MGSPSNDKPRYSQVLAAAGVVALLTAAFVLAGLRRPDAASPDSVVMESICQHLLDNTTVGRQALVSSIWWPPLPVLLRLPLVAAFGVESWPAPSLIVSALFGAAAFVLLGRILRAWGIGWLRFLILAAMLVNPAYLRECCSGSSATTVVFLSIVVMGGLVEWVSERKFRSLIYFGCGAALLALTSFEMGLWLVLLFLLLVLDQCFALAPRSQKEAVLILGLLPCLYAAGLWVLMNWLIMGDGLYYLRSLFSGGLRWNGAGPAAAGMEGLPLWAAAAALAAIAISVFLRAKAGAYAGVLVVSVAALALVLNAFGLLCNPAPVRLALFPLCLVAVACVVRALQPASRGLAGLAAAVPLVLVLLTAPGLQAAAVPARETARGDADLWRSRIRTHVLGRSPYAKVFVCGYDSFRLLGPAGGGVFVHTLDFNFNKVKDDYYGHTLFVLVHRPVGRSAADSIHWQYENVYALGYRNTLYDGDWGDWRLFEIIQAPRFGVFLKEAGKKR